ncbi:MAG: leucyl aminopeptidase family protein [Planctomycetaceae bacterium]|nr:leucyl aminopeptidase family protein [Planctomycetaceae bacterium]
MNQRIAIPIDVGSRAQGPIRVVPLTDARWDTLKRGGEGLSLGLEPSLVARLRAMAELSRFSAQGGAHLPVLDGEDRLVILLGLGREATRRSVREGAALATGLVPAGVAWSLLVPEPTAGGPTALELLGAAAEGVAQGPYAFKNSARPKPGVAGPCRLVSGAPEEAAKAQVARSLSLVEGVLLARDLVNTPAEELGPVELSDVAVDVARSHGMSVEVLRGEEVERRGFRLVSRVGRAAYRPSTVTIVEHRLGAGDPALALIGKGVVFDTGGLDIKTGGNMALMRKDMGGAGAVIGALDAIGRIGTELPFLAVIPAAENAVGPLAMRPGDVIAAYDGQTVEIGNTDAEGRLLLADALGYARERRAKRLVDAATLTGAARLALGPDLPALFGTDEDLVARLLDVAARSDEPLWRLPLIDRYESWIDTPFADVNNSSSDRRAGAITAALFLRRFAQGSPWAHIDVYAWEDRGSPGTPRGANGMSVRTLAELVLGLGG